MSELTEQEKLDYQTLGRFCGLAKISGEMSDADVARRLREIATEYQVLKAEPRRQAT